MSDKKPSFPRRALLVRASYENANSYADAFAVVSVEVLSVIDGKACCRVRSGSAFRVETHSVESLASTPERAAAKVKEHFAALLSRPLLQPVAGKTEAAAAVTLPSQTPAPEPLAGPRPPRQPWYATV
ncbi:MAG TPA: hypothetical protein VL357_12825 [Rariglobus sp.]|nr:hypothetical protein [Rariglobus sp.]